MQTLVLVALTDKPKLVREPPVELQLKVRGTLQAHLDSFRNLCRSGRGPGLAIVLLDSATGLIEGQRVVAAGAALENGEMAPRLSSGHEDRLVDHIDGRQIYDKVLDCVCVFVDRGREGSKQPDEELHHNTRTHNNSNSNKIISQVLFCEIEHSKTYQRQAQKTKLCHGTCRTKLRTKTREAHFLLFRNESRRWMARNSRIVAEMRCPKGQESGRCQEHREQTAR